MDDQTQIPDAPIEDAPKRRGRPPKSADVPDVAEPVAEPVPDVVVAQAEPLTFEQVMAWNRANADKMPQPVSLPAKKRAKSKRI